MAKYHINSKGEAGRCKASNKCPFGGELEHYSTPGDARRAYEKFMNSTGTIPQTDWTAPPRHAIDLQSAPDLETAQEVISGEVAKLIEGDSIDVYGITVALGSSYSFNSPIGNDYGSVYDLKQAQDTAKQIVKNEPQWDSDYRHSMEMIDQEVTKIKSHEVVQIHGLEIKREGGQYSLIDGTGNVLKLADSSVTHNQQLAAGIAKRVVTASGKWSSPDARTRIQTPKNIVQQAMAERKSRGKTTGIYWNNTIDDPAYMQKLFAKEGDWNGREELRKIEKELYPGESTYLISGNKQKKTWRELERRRLAWEIKRTPHRTTS